MTAELSFAVDNPDSGFLDLWQSPASRQQTLTQLGGATTWYNGWGDSRPPVGAVMVGAGHVNSGTLADDWLVMTVLSRSGSCFSVSREDVKAANSSGYAVGTFYRRSASVNGACPAPVSGDHPPTSAPSGVSADGAWGTSW